jgi:hypothetical protein
MISTASSVAKCSPMHTRAPPPNGNQAKRGRAARGRGVEPALGRNAAGSGHQRASRCVSQGLSITISPRAAAPRARRPAPGTGPGATASRKTNGTVGQRRSASSNTARA